MGNDKISTYGYSFCTKTITSVLTDKTFCSRIFDILKPEYFESDAMQWIINLTFKHFAEYKATPTMDVFNVAIDGVTDDVGRLEIKKCLRDIFSAIDATDLEFVKDTTLKFCKDRELKNAILESADLLKYSKYDEIKHIIDTAMQKGADTNIGMNYVEDVDRRYQENKRSPISTGWEVIDELTKGGLGPGELGVVAAGPGLGKSWLLSAIGAHAIKIGKRVLHITLELNEDYVGLRYDALLTGISLDNLEYNIDAVKQRIEKLPGQLIVKWYPTKSASLYTIKAHIDKLKMMNQSPDLLIIDYADLIKTVSKNQEKYEVLEGLYEELRGLAGEYWIPIWTASQIGRAGSADDLVEGDKIAGAFAKLFVADFAMTLSRKTKDKMSMVGRALIVKNRFGPDGIALPMKIDTSVGKYEFFSDQSGIGSDLKKSMKTDAEFDKTYISDRYEKFKMRGSINGPDNADKSDDYF